MITAAYCNLTKQSWLNDCAAVPISLSHGLPRCSPWLENKKCFTHRLLLKSKWAESPYYHPVDLAWLHPNYHKETCIALLKQCSSLSRLAFVRLQAILLTVNSKKVLLLNVAWWLVNTCQHCCHLGCWCGRSRHSTTSQACQIQCRVCLWHRGHFRHNGLNHCFINT